jgi:hypothetical protein
MENHNTPADFDMEDGALIDAFITQQGGAIC